jgi:hypothetical protein
VRALTVALSALFAYAAINGHLHPRLTYDTPTPPAAHATEQP